MKLHFASNRKERLWTAIFRYGMNFFPAYRRGGGRVAFISSDWREMHVYISLNIFTKNYVGTLYGGSMYSAMDPIYMLQFIKILGSEYVVWDKAASIKYIKPVRCRIFAKFEITDQILNDVISNVEKFGKYVIDLPVSFEDVSGEIYASGVKQIYIASKEYYKNRPAKA